MAGEHGEQGNMTTSYKDNVNVVVPNEVNGEPQARVAPLNLMVGGQSIGRWGSIQ